MRKLSPRAVFPLLVMAAFLLLPGCLSFNTGVRAVEPAAFLMQKKDYEVLGTSGGMHSGFTLFWFFPVTPRPEVDTALREAINQKGGDNLIDVRVWHERQIWIVGTIDIIHVRGKAVRYKEEERP